MVTARLLIDDSPCKRESALFLIRWRFHKFCETSKTEPTLRQARKYMRVYPETRKFLEEGEKGGYLS